VQIRAGETVVIGGLLQTSLVKDRRGIPLLMDIPLLGRLFSHTEDTQRRSELVIFLTPIIQSGQPNVGAGGPGGR
jgi:type II secretory pathway component GspD/PulD (secretin)